MTKKMLLLCLIVFAFVTLTARAQDIRAVPGDMIIAEYGEIKSAPIKIIEAASSLTFIQPTVSGFSPISLEGVAFGDPFAIELRFATEQNSDRFNLIFSWEDGEHDVIVYRADRTNKLFRSNLLQLDLIDGVAKLSEGGIEL